MICQDHSRLVRAYADAANGYAARVREMADFVISGQEVRINEARRICLTAWDLVEKTRVAPSALARNCQTLLAKSCQSSTDQNLASRAAELPL